MAIIIIIKAISTRFSAYKCFVCSL